MTNIPYSLIAKYLASECSDSERKELQDWISASPENAETFRKLSSTWSASSSDSAKWSDLKASVWTGIEQNRDKDKSARPARTLQRAIVWLTSIAAVLLCVCTATIIISENKVGQYSAQNIVVRTMPGQKSEVDLPDGTHVWLNSGTTVSYPADFNIKNRKVSLIEGEAFFDVAKSTRHSFILDADGIGVKVYGTKFDVSRYSDEDSIKVILQSGHIDVLSSRGNRLAEMFPGQRFSVDKKSGTRQITSCNADIEGLWRFGELKIERQTIHDVVNQMERWYGVNIVLRGNVSSDNLFWMTIKTETLTEMLEKINKIEPLDYNIDGDKVELAIR